jgi:Fe(3+) dicitrate transport protein
MRKSLVLTILVVLLNQIYGQTGSLHGQVLDAQNDTALAAASALIVELNRVTEADTKGFFSFKNLPYGTYQLIISEASKAPLRTAVDIDQPKVEAIFRLGELSYDMGPVEIRGDGNGGMGIRRLRAVEGTAIYAGKKSEVVLLDDAAINLAANNPRQVFARVAGLNIWESDGAGLQLGIGGRGLSPNRTSNFNTRQNGYDIAADALGYPESYYTPPSEALSRIEVVRGAASLQYGTQFGGMLNFVFRQPSKKPFQLRTRQTLGAWGFFASYNEVSGTLAKEKLDYFGYIQHKRGDGWRENSGFELTGGFASLRYRPSERLHLGLEWTRMSYLAQQPGGLTDVFFERDPRLSYRDRNWFEVDWSLLAGTLDYRFDERTRLNIRAFGLDASRSALGNLAPINVVDLGGNRDLIEGLFRNIGAEARFLHRYELGGNEQVVLVGGRIYRGNNTSRQGEASDGSEASFVFNQPENVERSDYDFDNTNYALFAENVFFVGKKLSITPGLRWEFIRTEAAGFYKQRVFDAAGNLITESRVDEQTERPRSFLLAGLGLSYKANRSLELYGNISQNYRAINFSDLRIDNPNGRVDPNIVDEQGFTADLGLRSRASSLWYADVTAFYVAYRDRIGLLLRADEPPLFNDYRLRTNIADARNVGIEAFGELNFWELLAPKDTVTRFSLFLNASITDARYINTDDRSIANKQVELVPPATLRTGLNFRSGPWQASATWAWTASHFTDATNAERTSTAVNGRIPAYSVADITASYTWKWLRLESSVNNVLDERYFTRRADGYPGPGIIPADGRSWFITLAGRF